MEVQEAMDFMRYQQAINEWYAKEPPLWKIFSRWKWKRQRPNHKKENKHV